MNKYLTIDEADRMLSVMDNMLIVISDLEKRVDALELSELELLRILATNWSVNK